jgi:predicted glycosyltransferase involved in capsule biosynthesis
MSKVAVVIPWRPVPSRMLAFKKVVRFYRKKFPNFEIIISDSIGEKFNLSQARNLGAKKAIDNGADIIIFNDADLFASPDSIKESIKYSIANNEISAPYNRYHEHYTKQETDLFFADFDYNLDLGYLALPPELPADGSIPKIFYPCSGCIVVPKDIFLSIGGFEEEIIGWGPEDLWFHKQYYDIYKKLFHYVDGSAHSTYNDPSCRVRAPEHEKYLDILASGK